MQQIQHQNAELLRTQKIPNEQQAYQTIIFIAKKNPIIHHVHPIWRSKAHDEHWKTQPVQHSINTTLLPTVHKSPWNTTAMGWRNPNQIDGCQYQQSTQITSSINHISAKLNHLCHYNVSFQIYRNNQNHNHSHKSLTSPPFHSHSIVYQANNHI